MQKIRLHATIALTAFILMLTIVSVPFVMAAAPTYSSVPQNPLYPIPSGQSGAAPWYWTSYRKDNYNSSGTAYNPACNGPTTSHILWNKEVVLGGDINTQAQESSGLDTAVAQGGGFTGAVGAAGRLVYVAAGNIICVDEWTGQTLWMYPASASDFATDGSNVIYMSGTYVQYVNLFTGANGTRYNFPRSVTYFGNYTVLGTTRLVGICTATPTGQRDNFYYAYTASTSASSSVLLWGPTAAPTYGQSLADGVIIGQYPTHAFQVGISLNTGKLLWTKAITALSLGGAAGYGLFYQGGDDGAMHAYNIQTGQEVWRTQVNGTYWAERGMCVGGGEIVDSDGAGNFFGFNATTGALVWEIHSVPQYYYPDLIWYGAHPFSVGPYGAGTSDKTAMFYDGTGGHMISGWNREEPDEYMYGVAGNGTLMWKYPFASHAHTPQHCIVDGIFFASSQYDGLAYAFTEGPSQTSVSVTQSQVPLGGYTWITGSVLDESPAQPGTPCVSAKSMDAWMAFLHFKGSADPRPNVEGVPVSLLAVSSDGKTVINIGTVTTNSAGLFQYRWTPPSTEDVWTITATFAGDAAYYSSWASTALAVDPVFAASASTPSSIAAPASANMTGIIAISLAAVLGTCIVGIAALRKNKGGIKK